MSRLRAAGARGTARASDCVATAVVAAALLTACGASGSSNSSRSSGPSNPPPAAPTVSLSADSTSVSTNATVTVTWTSTNATSCAASGGWSGTKVTAGSEQVGPFASTTDFALTCTGAGGSSSQTLTITVNDVGSALVGHVDSSFIDLQGDNRVYVFAGAVTPHDDNGSGDAIYKVAVTQDDNACTFSYRLAGLAPGTYTLAFTWQAQNDRPGINDGLPFVGTATVKVGASVITTDIAAANMLRVGTGKPFASVRAAAAAALDGAVIEIDAGTYNDDIVVWGQNHLTVRGVGGRAHIHGTAVIPYVSGDPLQNGKGLWVVNGSNMRVENMEFSGARVTDQNGAGIRNSGGNLTICNGYFHDNENGFLGEANGALTIEYTTFDNNGLGSAGYTHNVYVDGGPNPGDKLVFRYNYSHHVHIGHLLKTRARENYVLYNRLSDEADGTSSYNIDVPNGGLTYVVGNLIQQGPNTDNPTMVSYGAEGLSSGRTHSLYVVNNTFVNDLGSGHFLDVVSGAGAFLSVNNLFVFSGTLYSGLQPQAKTNLQTSTAGLVNVSGYDYHLTSASPAVNAGSAPGSANGFDLIAIYQYVHPAQREARKAKGTIDIGAYAY
jgi:hypothetical protein